MITIEQIEQAAKRIQSHIHLTPVVTSTLLNNWLGHEIFFKLECHQKIGAFKARGGCNAVAKLIESHARPEVIANSSGNHAQAIAWSAKRFDLPCTIYMPANSSAVKIQATQSYGANVVLTADRFQADEQVARHAERQNTVWIPPYNHKDVIAGQGTAALEALQQLKNCDAIAAPCGGGGLLSGSYIAAKAHNADIAVIGAEPEQASDAIASVKAGNIIKLSVPPTTIADGARTLAVGELTFPYLQKLDAFYPVSEQQIIYWSQWLQHLLKVHVEPTSAMTMAAVCEWLASQKSKKRVMVIVSGGNIDQATMQLIWQHDHLSDEPRI